MAVLGSDHAPRRAWVFAAALLSIALLLDLLFLPNTLEDAFISFRYAAHLAQGHGLGAWNLGDGRVEGYTSLLWVLLLALGAKLSLGPVALSKVFGVASHLAAVALLLAAPARLARAGDANHPLAAEDGAACRIAALFLALNLSVCWYSGSGMEALPFVFGLVIILTWPYPASRRSALFLALACAALVLLRPEGPLVALATQALGVIVARRSGRHARPYGITVIVTLLATVFLTVLRLELFQAWLPNTYYAKASGAGVMHVLYGARYVAEWAIAHQLWLAFAIAATVGAARTLESERLSIWTLGVAALLVAYLAYVLKVGGDNYSAFPYWRHMVHVSPLLAALGGLGLVRLFPRQPAVRYAAAALAVASINSALLIAPHGMMGRDLSKLPHGPNVFRTRPDSSLIHWFRVYTRPGTVVATGMAGELPFAIDRVVYIDILGLNDAHIAREGRFDPAGPPDSKTDMRYVLSRKPDVIDGYVSAKRLRAGGSARELLSYRNQMLRTLVDDPEFQANYLFLLNGPYQTMDRALFLRRDFWESHPRRSELHCIPVLATSLYGDSAAARPALRTQAAGRSP